MKRSIPSLAWWLLVCPASGQQGNVPTYTNEDLDRVARFREQTGALATPALQESPADLPRLGARDEDYWRRQARQLEERLSGLRRRADELRARIETAREDQRRRAVGRRSPTPSVPALEQRLAALEREMRERRDELEDRARRSGALPGWLR